MDACRVLRWLTVLAGERRKGTHHAVGLGDGCQDIGLLDGIGTGDQEVACVASQSSFPECLFPPVDDNVFAEPFFLSDMLLLDPPSTGREQTNTNTTGSIPDAPPSTRPHASSLTSTTTDTNTSTTRSLPSPYKNHLTVQKLNFYAARIQNALHLGLPTFLAQKEDDISPWYWHTQFALLISQDPFLDPSFTKPSTYSFSVNRPVRRTPCFTMSTGIISDLSPTPIQRSHAHGMYLDVIPFPVFRDRAIMLLSTDPPAFDERELKRDMENEGLMVWGVGHGSTDRAASLVRDRRNWECAGWFWRKWRLLVNGSGLDEQSRWWRTMRGEDGESDEEEM